MAGGTVIVVSSDERWLRVLEVTVRLGGYTPAPRRSLRDGLQVRDGDERARAVVLDLGVEASREEVDNARQLLVGAGIPAILVLPERMADERDRLETVGLRVIMRPYPPSLLYEAIAGWTSDVPTPVDPVPTPSAAPAAPRPPSPDADGG